MGIDIDRLSEQELVDLNHRLRFMREARAHSEMLRYTIGDRVFFRTNDGRTIAGTLTRYNKKSVTVVTESGQRWTVAPQLLIRVDVSEPPHAPSTDSPRLLE